MKAAAGRVVLDHVVEHREQLDMGDYGSVDPECGTIACLAGWTLLLLGGFRLDRLDRFVGPDGVRIGTFAIAGCASKLLELTGDEYDGPDGYDCSLFAPQDDDAAIARFRALRGSGRSR